MSSAEPTAHAAGLAADDLERLLPQIRRSRGWIRLPAELAAAYRADRNRTEHRFLVVSLAIGMLIYNSFLISDWALLPDLFTESLVLRLCVVTPIGLLYFPLAAWVLRTRPSSLLHQWYAGAVGVALVASLCTLHVLSTAPQAATYFVGSFLIVTFFASVMRASLLVTVVSQLGMFVVFGTAMLYVTVSSASVRLDAVISMVGFVIFGVLIAHRDECISRDRFVMACATTIAESRRRALIEELAAANRRLAVEAIHDPLTGLPNRRGLSTVVEDWAGQEPTGQGTTRRERGAGLAVLVLDLDRFKAYNDGFGHPAGDDCLRRVATTLQASLRGDTVLARYGGEEFVAVLRDVEPRQAMAAAERLRAAVERLALPMPGPARTSSHPWGPSVVTVSIGVACATGEPVESLLPAADRALYEAKTAGRNAVRLAEPTVDTSPTVGEAIAPAAW